jgi:hypothetical protein
MRAAREKRPNPQFVDRLLNKLEVKIFDCISTAIIPLVRADDLHPREPNQVRKSMRWRQAAVYEFKFTEF